MSRQHDLLRDSGVTNSTRRARFGAYAWFPGSGPAGKTCRICDYFEQNPRRVHWGKCRRYAELMSQHPDGKITPSISRKQAEISAATRSCRDFKPRPSSMAASTRSGG